MTRALVPALLFFALLFFAQLFLRSAFSGKGNSRI
jgi:hypothetical protein